MNEEVILRLEQLLPSADEAVLRFVAEASVRQILNYINCETLPAELVTAAVLISKAYYKSGGFAGDTGDVTSVKRGDVQTSFGAAKTAVSFGDNGDFFGYREMLNPFRKLRW
jgi:hypothetical protein